VNPPKTLVAWIGVADLLGAGVRQRKGGDGGPGPIAAALGAMPFDDVLLLSDFPKPERDAYLAWVGARTAAPISLRAVTLPSPSDYAAVYAAARDAIESLRASGPRALHLHLSPGTPAMTVVWILLGKLRYPATFIQSSLQEGVQVVDIPFDLAGDFVPDLLRARDEELAHRVGTAARASFGDIVHRDLAMVAAVAKAQRAAAHPYPVLLQGETGTGKELFARAIHSASPRAKGAFVAVNCGAIPEDRVEAELFGWTKGAFTGATDSHPGYFTQAHQGTLFLDEVGELPLSVQVKLLRALQESEVRPLGARQVTKVDVRIVAATHRDLLAEVAAGRFREDLFYRLAILALKVPPLRERGEDVLLLANAIVERLTSPDGVRKKLSRDARELVLRHAWPGNVRELQATLLRAVVWSDGAVIHAKALQEAMLGGERAHDAAILGRPLGDGFDLRALLTEVARHYLVRALGESGGNKTRAAALLGLPSYQTLTNWLAKYRVKG
jgi:DNA-binding NtrC family response regulator